MTSAEGEERPVLVRRLIRPDGSQTVSLHVFCPGKGRSVPFEECRSCRACIEIVEGSQGDIIRCTPHRPTEGEVEDGVGALLRAPVVAVHANLPLRALAALFVDRQLAHVFIVDDREMVVGMVKDADLLRATPVRTSANAGEIMGIALPVPERTPLRRALLQMAVTHVRQAAIMSADGTLLGVLADIDGLRWLAAAARR